MNDLIGKSRVNFRTGPEMYSADESADCPQAQPSHPGITDAADRTCWWWLKLCPTRQIPADTPAMIRNVDADNRKSTIEAGAI